MATSPGPSLTTITCPTCDVTSTQAPGTRRTICPHCGNFYDAQTAADARLRTVNRPASHERLPLLGRNDKDKSGSRLQSLANFFHNLGPNRRAKSGENSRNNSQNRSRTPSKMGLPPITPNGRIVVTPEIRTPGSRPNSNVKSTGQGSIAHNNNEINAILQNRKVIHPTWSRNVESLRSEIEKARHTGNWKSIQDFYASAFDSFTEINEVFKKDPSKDYRTTEDPGIKMDYVNDIYDALSAFPQEVQKVVLKSIINSLLKDKRLSETTLAGPHTKDDLRAYLVLVQNPQFASVTTYVIFAHLLRQMAALSDHDHHFLVHWFRRISAERFRSLIQKLHSFISCRLFPPKPQDLPPMSKCTWWIPSATKVLALLNAANNLCNPSLVSYMEFYNDTLDHLDLMAEYYTWQNPSAHPGFSFCQYPFILSITAKRSVLQRDSEQQMIIMARRSLVAKVQRRQLPDIGMLFLNLTVRRSHLVSDSLNEVARKQHDLKKKLKVTFAGEPGLDMGGLTKEWFLLLIRQIFQPEYGMFQYDKKARVFWFSSAPCDNYQEFNLVGVLMGLAVYNSIILDIRFPPCCYKKLLSPAVVPYNNPRATVGVAPTSLDDLFQTMPDLAHGLKELLDYEGDVEEDFGITYQISYKEFGSMKTHILKSGGENIPVTNQTRKEYVNLYVDWILNRSIYHQFQAFYHGFHSVCASNALIMLRPEEVEMLVCGSPNLHMSELRKVTTYDGYTANDITIKNYWEIVLNMSKDLQKRLLLFATGSDRIPIGGMTEMQFKITRVDNTDMLPMAHTCFNQLVLPAYKSKKTLKQKLVIAIQNAEGFGIE